MITHWASAGLSVGISTCYLVVMAGVQVLVLLSSAGLHRRPYDLVVFNSPSSRSVIYWTDSRRDVIAACRPDGTDVGVIVDSSPQFKPRHLAVDACLGLVE